MDDRVVAGNVSIYRHAPPLCADRLLSWLTAGPIEGRSLKEFAPDTLILERNSPSTGIWIVMDGVARLMFPRQAWNASYSRPAVVGELIGLTETFADLPFEATLVAVTRCVCLGIQRPYLISLFDREPELRAEIVTALAKGLHHAYSGAPSPVTPVTDTHNEIGIC